MMRVCGDGAGRIAIAVRSGVGRGPVLELLVVPFAAVLLTGLVMSKGAALNGDPHVFFLRAIAVLAGRVPFRDFASEYPPLSLLPMTLPHLWPDVDQGGFFALLNAENGIVASVLGLTVLWLARRSWSSRGDARALATWALLIVLMAPVAAWRFDLAASLLMMVGVVAAVGHRPGLAGVALGLGALTKIFPLVVLPILAIRCLADGDKRAAVRLIAACGMTMALGMLPFLVAAGPGSLSFVDYQVVRGLQVESTGGGLLLLAHLLGPVPVSIGFLHQSFEVASPLSMTVTGALTPIALGLYGLIVLACWRRIRFERDEFGAVQGRSMVAYLAAALLAVILTDRVLSPQYLLWVLPLCALLPRRQAALMMLACLLTVAIYPLGYDALLQQRPELVILVDARNLLLSVLLIWLVVGRARRERTRPDAVAPARLIGAVTEGPG